MGVGRRHARPARGAGLSARMSTASHTLLFRARAKRADAAAVGNDTRALTCGAAVAAPARGVASRSPCDARCLRQALLATGAAGGARVDGRIGEAGTVTASPLRARGLPV